MKKMLFFVLAVSACQSFSQSLRNLYQQGVQAYDSNDYELFKEKMKQINDERPNYPAVVYNLAGGYALTGNDSLALKTLNQYVSLDAITDFTKDSDFDALIGNPGYEKLLRKKESLNKSMNVHHLYSFPILDAHPESITYHKKSKHFFFGGVRDGNIWMVSPNNQPIIWANPGKNSWSVMGLEITNNEEVLWVCTSAISNYQGYKQHEEGYSSIFKYRLKTKELMDKYILPGGHVFGDLISDQKGNVFISDGSSNKIYWINKRTNQLEELYDVSKNIFNLQGICFGKDENTLFLSDYVDGIYKFEIDEKALSKLLVEDGDILIQGIDGLYYKKGHLIGLHNGTKPNRVVKYELSKDQNSIINKEVLTQGDILDEPTQGVWIKDQLLYIINSPWGAYDTDGNFSPVEKNLKIGSLK